MPARWPISETDVSQLPRCPTASRTVSSAEALPPSHASASAAASAVLIRILPVLFSSGHAFARRLAPAAQGTPVHVFWNNTFVGTDRRMRDARARGADRRPAVLHRARGLHHEAAERRDRDVARAEPLLAAVRDRPHALPHRDVLVRDAGDAGEIALFHGGAILQVVVLARFSY